MEKFEIGDQVIWTACDINKDDYPELVGTIAKVLGIHTLRFPASFRGRVISWVVDIQREDGYVESGLYPIRFKVIKQKEPSWEL